ncbi:MAG: TrmH family RNA methyltransferase [Nanoarchaeota archaeon]|nr:TrmH family RNA methyltransferase [Nanoarchaeota archaeon]
MKLSKVNEGRKKKIERYYSNKIKDVELLIDNVWDPHNVAAIARTADGLGIERINLYYTYNKFPNFKDLGKKSSSSANKWIKFDKIGNLEEFASERKKRGWHFIGSCWKEGAQDLRECSFPDKCIIVLGSESKGLSLEIEKTCENFIFIPMVGMTESYNVSVAAALIMYKIFENKGQNLALRIKDTIRKV